MACGVKQDLLWGFLFGMLQVILNLRDNLNIHPTKKTSNHEQWTPNENLTQPKCFGLKLAAGKG